MYFCGYTLYRWKSVIKNYVYITIIDETSWFVAMQ